LEEDVQGLEDGINFVELTKLAVKFADGVVQGSETLHPEIEAYLSTIGGKPFLPYRQQPQDVCIDTINRFYDSIIDSNTL
jgi:starch synthase